MLYVFAFLCLIANFILSMVLVINQLEGSMEGNVFSPFYVLYYPILFSLTIFYVLLFYLTPPRARSALCCSPHGFSCAMFHVEHSIISF